VQREVLLNSNETTSGMSGLLYGSVKLFIGTLYPAYESFKAVKDRNVKEYVKWMTYWIVYSLVCLVEEFTDVFVSWLPFYYELKICLLLWLISPTTRGASVLYRGLVHPTLVSKEDEIDEFLESLLQQSYTLGLRYAKVAAQKFTKTMIETAIKGGGGLVTTLKRSVSMNDLNQSDEEDFVQERSYGEERWKRRSGMTKSWHEGYHDQEDNTREGEGRTREGFVREGSIKKYRQSPDTRRLYTRRRPKERSAEDDIGSEAASSDSAYSTLPRANRRGRSQTLDTGLSGSRQKSEVSKKQTGSLSSTTKGSVTSRSTMSLSEVRRRPASRKLKQTKDTIKENEFSMSYSEVEEKKSSCQIN